MADQRSRRKFLKTAGIVAAATGVALCGGGTLAATVHAPIDRPSALYGDNLNRKMLVAYATKAGSTAEIALRMGEVIAGAGWMVDVKPIDDVSDLSMFEAVLLGSPIRIGAVLKKVTAFIEEHQTELAQKHFSMFIACMELEPDIPETRELASAYLDPVRAILKPEREGLFAGKVDPDKLTLLERMMMQSLESPIGDYRDWEKIEAWASEVASAV
ncbi:MAG: twin-arginine translocation signal domain-containing protein [Anaerolineaceae bacterium]|nr:twin-arginine translocation signal domain-containing protein [Anaerolineaceae bacterium]